MAGALQGLNIGGGGGSTREIRIRLRRAGRELDFFDYMHILVRRARKAACWAALLLSLWG